jgi:glycosyltransferase involved in cell wall biosynthesis
MLIGIDASRAFLRKRTGIEEYSYQVIRHLRNAIPREDRVVLYVRKKLVFRGGSVTVHTPEIGFTLPERWTVRALWAPRFWTQARLSLEMLLHPPDVLFVPAHTVPLIHPARTIVTVHGLEYEFVPQAYSFWERWYMRLSIRFSVRAARTVIAVSENTKRDLMKLYGVAQSNIRVVYEGYERHNQIPRHQDQAHPKFKIPNSKYLLFLGRLEERKNVVRIIEAFAILKEKHRIPHALLLAGKPGYGYSKIRFAIQDSRFKNDIRELGYVSDEEKWALLRGADAFLFPSLYEGFGIPILETQSVGVPVVTSRVSSLPEVAGEGAAYCDSLSAESIAAATWKTLSDSAFRGDIIEEATHNVNRFRWEKCAVGVAKILTETSQKHG